MSMIIVWFSPVIMKAMTNVTVKSSLQALGMNEKSQRRKS